MQACSAVESTALGLQLPNVLATSEPSTSEPRPEESSSPVQSGLKVLALGMFISNVFCRSPIETVSNEGIRWRRN
jgi:hypothetical protein